MTGLRVSLDATAVPAKPGGAGRYVLNLAGEFADTGVTGDDMEVTVVCRQGDRARWEARAGAGRVVDVAPTRRPLRLAWEQTSLPRLLKRLPVDVHHGPHYTMPLAVREPSVVTIHDLSFFSHPEWHQKAKVAFFRGAIRVAAARAAAIVAVSHATAERLEARTNPRGVLHVIPHGVDHERFRPAAPDEEEADVRLRQRLGIEPGRRYVAFVGTLEPRKDVPSLVRAFDLIAAGHPDTVLVLAGARGWGVDAVEAAIVTARAADRVTLTGYVSEEENVALLRGAAVVAYPSLEEGFGLPALETMACGTPLVTTSGSAMEEVAGPAALLVSPGDTMGLAEALEASLAGGADVDQRIRLGLEVAGCHRWSTAARAHVDVYRSVA
ncbi:MAG TPA: glycosyltransferase family 1 protein [Acidimicrobiales bacterium]|nr:glycosyltransferase family 1 protein [Acidimicrobiales bacterium]